MYLLLENNRAMPAVGGAIAGYTKALEFRNGKSFRRVTEVVHERSPTMDERNHSVFLGADVLAAIATRYE